MGEADKTRERLLEWRRAVARLYLTGIISVIPVVLAIMLLSRPSPRMDGSVLFVLVCWLAFLTTRLLAPPAVQAVVVVTLMMVAAATGTLVLGLSPGPFLSGASGVLMAGVIYGRRVSFVLLLVLTLSLVSAGVLVSTGALDVVNRSATDPSLLANWIRLALFTALTIGLLQFVLTGLFDRMEAAWRATAEAAERERLEQEQRLAAERQAVEAQRLEAIGKLAGGVAHDFNNLLVVIMAWAEMLPVVKSEAQRTEGHDAILKAATQAAQLTRQLLSFARKSVVQPTAVDVDTFLTTTLGSLRRMVADGIKIEYAPVPLPRALVDETQLGQVILNLVVNARDAMPQGGAISLRAALLEPPHVTAEAPDRDARYVAITVSDTGVGMDEATRARIFEPFFTTKGPRKGTGLGLASVYGIVTQAKGFVHADSTPGQGSRFTVAFPVAPEGHVVADEGPAGAPKT